MLRSVALLQSNVSIASAQILHLSHHNTTRHRIINDAVSSFATNIAHVDVSHRAFAMPTTVNHIH